MNKGNLIFDWKTPDSHPLGKIVAVVVIALVFLVFGSLFTVRFTSPEVSSTQAASVLFFPDQEMGRLWLMKAEEEGPFPGRLEIAGLRESLDLIGSDNLEGLAAWNEYSISLKGMSAPDVGIQDGVSTKGVRYFPSRKSNVLPPSEKSLEAADIALMPVLIPYSDEAVEWLPDQLPDFQMPLEERVASASWRFVINLRSNGSVAQCLSLSGGDEVSLKSTIDWLESLRFEKSEKESRWMGLRIEFLNKAVDGTDPK